MLHPRAQLDGVLNAAIFAEAMASARKSVSKSELARYLSFKKDLSGGPKPAEKPAAATSEPESTGSGEAESEDDELYD